VEVEDVRENDYVFLTREATKALPELASKMAIGGVIKKIDDKGVAEVEITRVERIHISKLTLDDPIP